MEKYRSGHNGPDSKSGEVKASVGSNPTFSATSEQAAYRLLRLFFKSWSVLIPLLLLFRKRSRSRRLFACKRAHDGFGSLPTFCGDAGQLHLFRSTLPVRVSIWTLGFLFLQFRYEHRYHVAANPYDKVWYTPVSYTHLDVYKIQALQWSF